MDLELHVLDRSRGGDEVPVARAGVCAGARRIGDDADRDRRRTKILDVLAHAARPEHRDPVRRDPLRLLGDRLERAERRAVGGAAQHDEPHRLRVPRRRRPPRGIEDAREGILGDRRLIERPRGAAVADRARGAQIDRDRGCRHGASCSRIQSAIAGRYLYGMLLQTWFPSG